MCLASRCSISSNGWANVSSQMPHVVVTASKGDMYVLRSFVFPFDSRCEQMWDVSSMLLSSMRSHTVHLAGYLPMRRSAGKTFDVDESLDERLLFVVKDDDDSSRAAANAPCFLE